MFGKPSVAMKLASLSVVVAIVGACSGREEVPVGPGSALQEQEQEGSTVAGFSDLVVPPSTVEGLQTYEIVEVLMRRDDGTSACDDLHPVLVEHSESDGPGEYVRIPLELVLDEEVPVPLLMALEPLGIPFAAFRFRWTEEWRVVMFAPPRGAWGGAADHPTVIELGLNRLNDEEPPRTNPVGDESDRLVWSVNSAASLIGCNPAR